MRKNKKLPQLIIQLVLLTTLSLLAITSYSQPSSSAKALNKQAQQAFKSGDYRQALSYYKRVDDLSSNYTSQYNIAVCYYKLNNWQQAYRIFSELHAQDPMNEQVHLNLALAANRAGKAEEAFAHFKFLSDIAESDAIAALAYKHYLQLAKTMDRKDAAEFASSRWLLSAAFSIGTDDNVISPTDGSASTQSDTFYEQTLTAGWYSKADFNNSWLIDAVSYTSQYSEVSVYDVDVLALGIKKYTSLTDNHRLHLGLKLDQSSIGGTGYLKSSYYEIGTRHKLNKLDSLRFLVRLQDSDDRSIRYQGLAGTSLRMSADYQNRIGSHRLRLRYRVDQDDKNDDRYLDENGDVTVFSSYSADRNSLYGSWSYQSSRWRTELFLNYRDSLYKDAHIFDDGTPTTLREDQRSSVGLLLTRHLSNNWSLDFEVSSTDNRSTIDQYDYDQNIISLTIVWQN